MAIGSTISNLLAARTAGSSETQGSLSNEELFILIALELGLPPRGPHRGGKAPPVPGATLEWLQRFVEVCTVAGKTFVAQWEVEQTIEQYRSWYAADESKRHKLMGIK